MELEIYRALLKANVPEEDAKAVADAVNHEIDRRYNLHATQLFTKIDGATLRQDMAELKAELIKWCMGSIFGAVALFAALTKLWH